MDPIKEILHPNLKLVPQTGRDDVKNEILSRSRTVRRFQVWNKTGSGGIGCPTTCFESLPAFVFNILRLLKIKHLQREFTSPWMAPKT